MPKRSSKRRRSEPADEATPSTQLDEEDLDAFTLMTQQLDEGVEEAFQTNALKNVSDEERDELVSEVVRYILFKNFAKNGRPISQSELSEIVNKRYSGSKKGLSGPVVKLAQSKLLEIFGMELRPITRAVACTKGRSKKGSGSSGTTWYVVRSALPVALRKRLVQIPLNMEMFNGFAMVVLGCIEAAGESLPEEELWRMLGALGVEQKREHASLGMAEEQLQKMCDMRYIIREKRTTPDGDTFWYMLAENALDEIGKDNIKAFVKQIAGVADDE